MAGAASPGINEEETRKLQQEPRFVRFHEWLAENGAQYPAVDYPVVFGKNGELRGLAAKKDIPPCKAFLFIPDKLMITIDVAMRDPVCAPIFKKHPEVFKDHYDAEYLALAVFVMH